MPPTARVVHDPGRAVCRSFLPGLSDQLHELADAECQVRLRVGQRKLTTVKPPQLHQAIPGQFTDPFQRGGLVRLISGIGF